MTVTKDMLATYYEDVHRRQAWCLARGNLSALWQENETPGRCAAEIRLVLMSPEQAAEHVAGLLEDGVRLTFDCSESHRTQYRDPDSGRPILFTPAEREAAGAVPVLYPAWAARKLDIRDDALVATPVR